MGNKPKNAIYVVEVGPENYQTFTAWPDCQAFVHGKPYPFAGGVSFEAAKAKIRETRGKQGQARDLRHRDSATASGGDGVAGQKPKRPVDAKRGPRPTEGICSDAGTHGNPGPCECQVTDLDGRLILHKHLGVHSNNYAELAGIGNMLNEAVKLGITQCWTDSKIALGWIASQKLGPTVHEPKALMAMILKINEILRENPQIKLQKWHTKAWGEIPADFGRK